MENIRPEAKGRGSRLDQLNGSGGPNHVLDLEHGKHDEEYLDGLHDRPTDYLPDRLKSIIAVNQSPDVGYRLRLHP